VETTDHTRHPFWGKGGGRFNIARELSRGGKEKKRIVVPHGVRGGSKRKRYTMLGTFKFRLRKRARGPRH